ncbi:thiamine phosphate synthase [Marinilongibacter aquaticus]|uniref:thiamine phosphate synthase n=1 Tax=Marinilongibacter aquaticus TaxID=2975157 RepID=UPI0021BD47D7|nr:thiamine phosphate synthase [Marinilongibacter aquaticus]UBM60575.1 thiamine phosphate synthase [Marinilongibacter aquaticus]
MKNGVYLIVDPSMPLDELLVKLEGALRAGLAAVQVWENWQDERVAEIKLKAVKRLCQDFDTPLLINNRWEWVAAFGLDGVHFDEIPEDWEQIKETVESECKMLGLTCNNEMEKIMWAENEGFSYISFCSMFPSKTSNSCELVRPEVVLEAQKLCGIRIFLAGGINPKNKEELSMLNANGLAVISGIMDKEDTYKATLAYKNENKNETGND